MPRPLAHRFRIRLLTAVHLALLVAAWSPGAAAANPTFPLVGGVRAAFQAPAGALGLDDNPHGEIALACETCHTADAWRPLRDPLPFDHDTDTAFPLTGRHTLAACQGCHLGLRFDQPDLGPDAGTPDTGAPDAAWPETCGSCHLDVHRGQLGPACGDCHTTTDFGLVAGVELHARTGFPLTGAHLGVACEACHDGDTDGAFFPLDPTCIGCHEADYAATATGSVDHAAAGFSTQCEACHTTLSFGTGTVFDHATASGGFGLVGAHSTLPCTACHEAGTLTPLFDPVDQNDCFTCHEGDHQAAHPAFPTTCLDCHTTSAFLPATFDHGAATGFALVGAHLPLACEACHVGPDFETLFDPAGQDDCVACHEADHQREHPAFPITCLDCHTTSSFDGAVFNHESATGFPLVGAHLALACESCHTLPDFDPIWDPAGPNDCFTCHEDDHQREHPAFPTTCLDCHTTDSFAGASFDHGSATGFALVGAHVALDCAACHTLPDFGLINTPAGQNDCVACHEDEYQEEHAGSGFPTTCLDCHSTDTWEGATFDHDPFFPIYSGRHQGEWDSCQTCHTVPGNFQVFTCLVCHEHRRSEMDDEHEDVGGYVYESNACYSCHPDGEED